MHGNPDCVIWSLVHQVDQDYIGTRGNGAIVNCNFDDVAGRI